MAANNNEAEIDEGLAVQEELSDAEHVLTCCIKDMPDKIYACQKAEIILSVACSKHCDLSGATVTLCGAEGSVIASEQLIKQVSKEWCTRSIEVTFPEEAGTYEWTVFFEPSPDEGLNGWQSEEDSEYPSDDEDSSWVPGDEYGLDACPLHEVQEFPAVLKVRSHKVSTLAWGLLGNHFVADEPFTFTVGAQCDASCDLKGQDISIIDIDAEKPVHTAKLEYFGGPMKTFWCADVTVKAPKDPGKHTWDIVLPADKVHEETHRPLMFWVIRQAPNALVRVHVQTTKGEPLTGASVSVQAKGDSPYRARTDDGGDAMIKVPEGIYTVGVSKSAYMSTQDQNITIKENSAANLTFVLEEDYMDY
ncbi:MAG: carboxypeptidase regulatory-like domain-containing protein [Coriobacteriales bacterium]|nr:carboxypeptidase regulatory-like domain-containing protein [Coriobacteriales bacterium]